MSRVGPKPTIIASSAPKSARGTSASSHIRPTREELAKRRSTTEPAASGLTASLHRSEDSHPSELGKLRLVSMKHEVARIAKCHFENGAFALAQHDRVGVILHGLAPAGAERVEKHSMEMKAVEKVELSDVYEVNADGATDGDANRIVHVRVRHRVDGVHFVVAVEVRVESIHDHHELVSRRAALARIDDVGAVEAAVEMSLQRHRVTVIEVQAGGFGVELVNERFARWNLVFRQRAVHRRVMPPVEVNGVRVAALIQEPDAHAIAFCHANRGSRHLAVVRPG